MTRPIFASLKQYWQIAHQQLVRTPERALHQAYSAALQIVALEENYFQGHKVEIDSTGYNKSVLNYFQTELQKYLSTVRLRLVEFNTSQSLVGLGYAKLALTGQDNSSHRLSDDDRTPSVLEQLNCIHRVLERYSGEDSLSSAFVSTPPGDVHQKPATTANSPESVSIASTDSVTNIETTLDKKSALPRSLAGTLHRIKTQLDPKAEATVIRNFRSSQSRTKSALRLLILLVLVPVLTQQLSKALVVGPIVEWVRKDGAETFLNAELESEALAELQAFEEKLKFQSFLSSAPKLSQAETEKQLQEKADELAGKYRGESAGAMKNVFSDILAMVAFAIVIFTNQRSVQALKAFMDEIAYGLSDSAKAFIIILFTDMFVGFHSPEGWEVLLDHLARHLGLPTSHDLTYLFIATVPVVMDTIFKYWIFRYLNGMSPSAVATYKEMNE
ncbi:MAG: proton extrusion protein PcxA [Leptolyngbya sp. BL-A-14]